MTVETILHFPALATLRLALTAVVPAPLGASPATAATGESGLWVRPSQALPQELVGELYRLQVTSHDVAPVPLVEEVLCWSQLLPLERVETLPPGEQMPVVFDLPATQLAGLVGEMLRLGNDRQGFRWLEDGDQGARVLLRVVGPPYYSLLRALDDDGPPDAPVAFAECASRVWAQIGYGHPLGEHLAPPAGKILFLRPPRSWFLLDDVPFRDIYEVLEFTLPNTRTAYKDVPWAHPLTVPLRLTRSGPAEAADLWVLRDRPLEQLDEFVGGADDLLLRQLSFAVAERDGQTLIVLRVRPSRSAPPELALDAVAFRSYLKLPNLFLPCGTALHPPLRRDAIRKLLAEGPGQVTWLHPHDNGRFTPECVPDEAFRPLADWVEYILDHDRRELQVWVESAQFDFEPFVCADEQPEVTRKKSTPSKERTPKGATKPVPGLQTLAPAPAPVKEKARRKKSEEAGEASDPGGVEPSELQKRLRAAEERFLVVEGALDAPERLALWPELAALNGALGRADEAGLSWINALWFTETPPEHWAWNWFRAEAATVPLRPEVGPTSGQTWVTRLALAVSADRLARASDLDALLSLPELTSADLGALAAYLTWAALQPAPLALVERLSRLQQVLEAHEHLLPVRANWSAWLALVRLAGGDVLALARARDRLLERLFQTGLRPEYDLPSFLRFSANGNSDRARAARDWLKNLAGLVQRWLKRMHHQLVKSEGLTTAYADLMLAFGLASIGETESARSLQARAESVLADRDDVHSFLCQAFSYRIRQTLEGKPHAGPLPAEFMDELDLLRKEHKKKEETTRGPDPTYIIDKLRDESRILEPDQKVVAHRHIVAKNSEVERELAILPEVRDADALVERFRKLLQAGGRKGESPEQLAMILKTALDQAPRIGGAFATELVVQVPAVNDQLAAVGCLSAIEKQANLLERGLFVAAHFDFAEPLRILIQRFHNLLDALQARESVKEIDTLAAQSFRGLRKLGMREESELLLQHMARRIVECQQEASLKALLDRVQKRDPATPDALVQALRALVHVAAGWLYFGRDKDAEPILRAARVALFEGSTGYLERMKLACAYVTALGQAPTEYACQRIEELFHRLDGIRDPFVTSSHYSLTQLKVIEATVRAVLSDDFTVGTQARRWLDDDEFLVRRRVHRDLRALMARHEA